MEISWKWLNLYLGLLLVGFCKGFPLNLEDTNTGHAQFLTGVAAILITVGSIVLAGCLCCQRRKGFEEFHNNPLVASAASTVEYGHVNPIANGEFTIFTPLSPPHFNNNVFLANEQVIRQSADDYICGDIDVSPWFDRSARDFPRIKLKYIRELGRGSFGKVVEGAAQDLDPGQTWTPVIVRILDAAANARERMLFLNDALFYLAPSHPNLLALKGQCLCSAPLLLLQESCSGGDLKARLRAVGNEDTILLWCCQLTSAVRHLHDNGFIHPDLAARNCLLTDSLTLKLGDYSLSASKYPEDYYKGGEPLISVRWRSPESLDCTPTTIQPKTLTKEANVWALGVVMWEICEDGSQPYDFLDDDEVISRVLGSECLRLDGPSKPQLYSDYIFRLIKLCWNNAESRPKVTQIDMMLSDLLRVHKNTQNPLPNANDDFDSRWDSLKPNTIVKTDNHNVSIDIEGDSEQDNISKPMSPSLYNLHGSLDNLSCNIKGLSDSTNYLESIFTEPDKSCTPDLNINKNIHFKLGPLPSPKTYKMPDSPIQNDSLTDSMIFKQGSSGSDTEEENWRRKVERGAYSEKVRLKSKSVADLMVLTHVDYSESESETPMPSMDYKSSRSLRKSNLENSSLNFSSEGNLLSLEDTFEKELKKLQVERRDSLLFVPDKSQTNSNLSLLHELSSPTEIKPVNQIYNIFTMSIDGFDSLRASGSKLNDIINIVDETRIFSRQDSENKSDLGYATLHNSERNSDFGSVDGEQLLEDRNAIIKSEIEERLKNCEFVAKHDLENLTCFEDAEEIQSPKNVNEKYERAYDQNLKTHLVADVLKELKIKNGKVGVCQQRKQNLPDILASLDQDHGQVIVDLLESNLLPTKIEDEDDTFLVHRDKLEVAKNTSLEMDSCSIEDETKRVQNNESHGRNVSSNMQIIVPKLSDLVLTNHKLMQFVSDRPHSDVGIVIHNELVSKESQNVPDLCSKNLESSDSFNSSVNINTNETIERRKHKIISNSEEDLLIKQEPTKVEVYTEILLPEIKQSFTKVPNLLESDLAEVKTYSDISNASKNTNVFNINSNEAIIQENRNSEALTKPASNLNLFLDAERNNTLADTPELLIETDLCDSRQETGQHSNDSSCDLNARIDVTEVIDLCPNKDYLTNEEAENVANYLINAKITTPIQGEQTYDGVVYEEPCGKSDENKPLNISSSDLQNMMTPPKKESDSKPIVAFDLSKNQEETMPNSLTHTAVFTSTPFGKKQDVSLPTENAYSSLNLFGTRQDDDDIFSSNFAPLQTSNLENENNKLNYSLETWDNFLGKSFDSSREGNDNLFDSFSSEPQSILFLEDDCQKESNVVRISEERKSQDETFVQEQTNEQTFIKEEPAKPANNTFVTDGTFVIEEEKNDVTFVMEDKKDGTFGMENPIENAVEENPAGGHWETGGGWFLHPQSNNNKLSGDIEPQPSTSKGSYIGFGVDDEIMTAIRNELLEKLPHAQGASHETVKEDEEWNQTERNEVFLRYNVYNTPLSPIPEESSFDENDEELVITGENTPKLNDSDSDWSDRCDPPALSSHTNDSPPIMLNNGQTASQSSCCSNDTLFNFDDFALVNEKEINTELEQQPKIMLHDDVFDKCTEDTNTERLDFTDDSDDKTLKNSDTAESGTYSCSNSYTKESEPIQNAECNLNTEKAGNVTMQPGSLESGILMTSQDQLSLNDFLINERNHTSSAGNSLSLSTKMVAPLPSPEDKPWKSLPASLLTYNTIQKPTLTIDHVDTVPKNDPYTLNECESSEAALKSSNDENYLISTASSEIKLLDQNIPHITIDMPNEIIGNSAKDFVTYENVPTSMVCSTEDDGVINLCEHPLEITSKDLSPTYENLDKHSKNITAITQAAEYENIPAMKENTITNDNENIISNEADYVNIENIEQTKDFLIDDKESLDYINSIDQHNSLILDEHNTRDDHDMFGFLTDIRFSGPIDSQLMSTSFSESNDVDEQDWDSGSDTRSSSSGEFIWKEGEHEESLKALTAAPHDVLEDIKPMEEITEETTDSDVSSSTSDEEGDNLEFVPSAWDKFATPTKSALRSPEKSLDRSESKKSKGVWFKKQKYHCVYEYPREPESPILHSHDLWKPQIDFAAFSDWEFDAETYLPPPTAESDINPSTFTFKPKINNSRRSLYYLTSPIEIQGDGSSTSSNGDEEFLGSQSRSLDTNAAVCSQFFPGASNWIENVTPDSGLDDSTPGSLSDSTEFSENYLAFRQVLPLKKLAAQVINKNKEINKGSNDVLGGLRHTRNKLKLDLPPSPSAFTSTKTFTVEPLQEPIVLRDKPTFSTFGKSRFSVQQVDTPPIDDILHQSKNVCFDVLPYKPINIITLSRNECQLNNDVTYEPLKKNFDEISAFSNRKDKLVKGEASLLDSADEDSGIESSTLERKISNVVHKENVRLE